MGERQGVLPNTSTQSPVPSTGPLKILLIAPQPFLEKRGTPLAVFQLLRALGELGHRVDLVTYHLGEDVELPGVRHFRTPSFSFVRRVGKGMSATKLFLDIFVFLKAVRLLMTNRYDRIHGVEEGAIMGGVLTLLWRAPLAYDMDSSIPEQLLESGHPVWGSRPVVWLAELVERWTVGRSAVVLPVCAALLERVQRIVPGKPMQLLEDIPNVEEFPPEGGGEVERLRRELGLVGKRVVLYTGTFEGYQGIDLLLHAVPDVVAAAPDAAFVLVGGDPEQVREKQAQAASLGLNGEVLILGKRPLEEMPFFMEMASVLVSPRNRGNNTPMKIYTYLQSGRPVVATRLPTHTQVLNDDVALLVEPTSTALSGGIARLLADPARGTSLGRAGAELVRERYSYAGFKDKVARACELIKI